MPVAAKVGHFGIIFLIRYFKKNKHLKEKLEFEPNLHTHKHTLIVC